MNRFLYIPYCSFHDRSTLRGFIRTEATRFIRNSSDRAAYVDTLSFFINNLRARGYPTKFIAKSLTGISYDNRSTYLQPPQHKAKVWDDSLVIFITHLDHLTKFKYFKSIILRYSNTLMSEPRLAENLKDTRFIIAKRRAPSLYRILINNRAPPAPSQEKQGK